MAGTPLILYVPPKGNPPDNANELAFDEHTGEKLASDTFGDNALIVIGLLNT